MKVEAARRFHFQAVHSLEGYPDPWCHTHGHHYTLELVGEFNHEQADQRWEERRTFYEHRDLNEVVIPTTVEVLAGLFLDEFKDVDGIREATVWEDDDRWGRASR